MIHGSNHHCVNCLFKLDILNSAFVSCSSCDLPLLCPRCSITIDIPLCLNCKSNQHPVKMLKIETCKSCSSNSAELSQCFKCKNMYCNTCNSNGSHLCLQWCSQQCGRLKHKDCCRLIWCSPCYSRHVKTNCKVQLSRVCSKCSRSVCMFGADKEKCPVLGCPLVFPCKSCALVKTYCIHHTSARICAHCICYYPLDPMMPTGKVSILILFGNKKPSFDLCGHCFARMLSFVESILIVFKRTRQPLSKTIIDQIILFAYPFLELTSSSN